ncbi:MAG: helix-hairpin-helix domain-containing protein [Paludibacteraceae bacterium]|nr:helix-hairpin-helix domain-containing protein [Paludibacteraceae bacterium]
MRQKYGTLIFSILIAIALLLFFISRQANRPQHNIAIPIDSATVRLFSDSLVRLDSMYKQSLRFEKKDTIAINRHPFDPNTVDSIELLEQGFKPWQVRNMLKYRAKGGKWKVPADLKKIYGVDSAFYATIEPYISIPTDTTDTTDSVNKDSITSHFIVKKDTIVEINSADTADLQKVKNIGPYIARLIVGYRDRLGGYYSIEQIKEIEDLPIGSFEKFSESLAVDTSYIRKININKATIKQISFHPYIRTQQAKQIYDYRREKIRINNLDELEQKEIFTPGQWNKVQHYLSCN